MLKLILAFPLFYDYITKYVHEFFWISKKNIIRKFLFRANDKADDIYIDNNIFPIACEESPEFLITKENLIKLLVNIQNEKVRGRNW